MCDATADTGGAPTGQQGNAYEGIPGGASSSVRRIGPHLLQALYRPICMYVCVYVCMYVRMYVCVHVRVCIYSCMYVPMYVRMYVCMYV